VHGLVVYELTATRIKEYGKNDIALLVGCADTVLWDGDNTKQDQKSRMLHSSY